MRLDNLTFPIGQADIDGTLSVIDSIAGTAWTYRSQQPATPGGLPLMPAAAVGGPPPSAGKSPRASWHCARRLLRGVAGRQLQQVVVPDPPSPPLAGSGTCPGTNNAIVPNLAACAELCKAQLASSGSAGVAGASLEPDTYAGPGGELCCNQTWYLPPNLGATVPADASGVFLFADSPVPASQVDGVVSSMYASSDNGYFPNQLRAAGVPVSGASVLYVGVDDPVFSAPPADQQGAPDSASSSSTGIIVGVVAGVAAALAVATVLALVVSRRRRRRQQQATREATRHWRAAAANGGGKSAAASRAGSAALSVHQSSVAGSEDGGVSGTNGRSAAADEPRAAAGAPGGPPLVWAAAQPAADSSAVPADMTAQPVQPAQPAHRPGEWEAKMRARLGLDR
ncbi:hypothetical protein ABPG77_000464 [Micractinium sp. CCAP 211/92]